MKALSFNYEQEENNLIQEILQMQEENVDILNEKTNAMKQEVWIVQVIFIRITVITTFTK